MMGMKKQFHRPTEVMLCITIRCCANNLHIHISMWSSLESTFISKWTFSSKIGQRILPKLTNNVDYLFVDCSYQDQAYEAA